MAAPSTARPVATTIEVERLVTLAWRGEIRVPRFQRDFRWLRRDVARLFESVLLGYPVGSLLLWRHKADAATARLGALQLDVPATDQALWVVDGQQRITSLANALHPDAWDDDRFRIAYDVVGKRFVHLPAQWVENPRMIPLPVLFDLRRVLNWFHTNPDVADYADQASEVTTTLRQYRVPAYEVAHDDEGVLREIFDRMNNYGKRLSRAEVFSALFAGDRARDQSRDLERIAAGVDTDLRFGIIDQDTVLKAVLAQRGPNVLREIRNEFGGEEDLDAAYRLGEEALRRAVSFLQKTANVPHITFLPYRYLLVVLARLFGRHPMPDPASLRRLRRWFWRAAVIGPGVFKGGTTGAIRTLCYAVRSDNLTTSIDQLLRLVDRPERPVPDLRRFRSNDAGTKIALCAWWAEEPRTLRDGEVIEHGELWQSLLDRTTAADAIRRIVPSNRIPEHQRFWAANRILLPDSGAEEGAVEGLLASRPLDVPDDRWRAALHSHLADASLTEILTAGDLTDFLAARQERLHTHLTTFLDRTCEWEFEDTPPLEELVVDDLSDGDDEPA